MQSARLAHDVSASRHGMTAAIEQPKDGDPRAAAEIDYYIRAELLAFIRSKKRGGVATGTDTEAAVATSFRRLLKGAQDGKLSGVTNTESLRKLKFRIARNAFLDQVRKLGRAQDNVELSVAESADDSVSESQDWARLSHLLDSIYEVAAGFGDEAVAIWEGRLNEFTETQIGEELGIGRNKVNRIWGKVMSACREKLGEEYAGLYNADVDTVE